MTRWYIVQLTTTAMIIPPRAKYCLDQHFTYLLLYKIITTHVAGIILQLRDFSNISFNEFTILDSICLYKLWCFRKLSVYFSSE